MPWQKLWLILCYAILFCLARCALGNPTSDYSELGRGKVMASPIGSSWVSAMDFFWATGAPRGEPLEASLSLEKWYKAIEIPLESTDKSVWYSVYVSNQMKKKWENIVRKNLVYKFLIGNEKVNVPFGSIEGDQAMVYMQKEFFIVKENGKIVRGKVVSSSLSPIIEGKEATFFFSVSILSRDRFSEKFDDGLPPHESTARIINIVIILFLLACTYIFVFKHIDRVSENQIDNLHFNAILSDSYSWQLLSADVFRRTRSGISLCAFIGAGVSHFFSVFLLGTYWKHSTGFTFFIPTFFIGGCTAGYFLVRNVLHPINSRKILKCLFLMTLMIAFPFVLGVSALFTRNLFSLYISTGDVVAGFSLSLNLLAGSLCGYCGIYVGMFLNKKMHYSSKFPQINQVPRLVPPPRYKFLKKQNIILLGGLVTYVNVAEGFSKHLENSFLFTSLDSLFTWDYCIFFILSTLCVSLLGTFTLLNLEEHKWKWASFGFGSSILLYLLLYSAAFYILRIGSFNIISLTVYWSYSLGLIIFISVLGGSLSFICASALVDSMYGKITGKDS